MTITISDANYQPEYIMASDITYVTTNNQTTEIHLSDGSKKETKEPFTQIVNQLSLVDFYQAEETLCIHLKQIADIRKEEFDNEEKVHFKNGSTAAVDWRKMKDLKYKLMAYDSSFIQKLQAAANKPPY